MKRLHLIAFCSALLVFAGCVQQRVVWSPSGTKAVVLGEDGLRIMNPDGRLSAMLLPNVVSAAWFPDSSALALARFREVRKWNGLLD